MLRVASEVRFYTPEQVEALLEEAVAITARLEVFDHLAVAVFNRAVDLLAAGHRELEQTTMGVPNMTIPGNRK